MIYFLKMSASLETFDKCFFPFFNKISLENLKIKIKYGEATASIIFEVVYYKYFFIERTKNE